MSDCTDSACAEYATCQKKATGKFILSWGDPAEARPCTDGDDDSEYGPSGDDQKCVDEGYSDEQFQNDLDDEDGIPRHDDGAPFSDEETEEAEDYVQWGGSGGGEGYEDDVPEGYQEVDTEDPMDPEGGDWETLLDQEEPSDDDLKKTMKQEDKAAQQEKKAADQTSKEQSRTAISIPRDPSLDPSAYHQFWDASHLGHTGVDEQRNFTLQKSVQILEERLKNASSPEEADAVRSILMNGPKAGGTYQKTKKAAPGEPGAEDFIDREDKSPII
jgi:hypothetical protein